MHKSSVFGLPVDATAAAKAAGLPMLSQEELAVHYHAHLDVIVDGNAVPVPANIGIDQARRSISPLHVHDGSGIVHIEAAKDIPFTLGQVFDEWQVPFSSTQLGDKVADNVKGVRVYVNGVAVTGDPRSVVLKAHQEITVAYGAAGVPATIASTYAFPAGD
jgi:hypothetical protein